MTVHDLSYRSWRGRLRSRGWTWWIIGWSGIRLQLKKKLFILALIASAIYFLVWAIRLHLSTMVGASIGFEVDPDFFRSFLVQQHLVLFFVSLLAGSGLIANDLRHRTLPFYFSKPLTAADFIAGKFTTVALFLAAITFVPGQLLYLMRVVYGGGDEFAGQYGWLPLSIGLFSLIQVTVFGLTILALSSLTRSGRSAGLLYFGVYFLPGIVHRLLQLIIYRDRPLPPFAIDDHLERISLAIFQNPTAQGFESVISFVVCAAVVIGAIAILSTRIRPEEVIR